MVFFCIYTHHKNIFGKEIRRNFKYNQRNNGVRVFKFDVRVRVVKTAPA